MKQEIAMKRRNFIRHASTAGILAGCPALLRGQNLNSRIQLAAVGTEGRGWADLSAMASHAKGKYVALCDVDLARTAKARKLSPDAPVFQDYREMLAKTGDTVDAVTVGIPDHMHARVSLDCMRKGKHLFCQKPLTHNVWEARQMRLQAAKSKVITRMGNQIHSHTFYRTAVQLIQEGAIGKVQRVHSWVAATGHGKSGHIDRPRSAPVPEKLAWDVWLGVAPERPYVEGKVYHPWGWRDWQDFGNGALGDFGCHILDPVFTALRIDEPPTEIKCSYHSGMNNEVWPAQNVVEYKFPGNQLSGKILPITWYDGNRLPRDRGRHLPRNEALPASGSLFIGEEGTLVLPHVGAPKLHPQKKFADHAYELADNQNHFHGWLDGIISGKQPSDGFDYAGPLTEAVLLGNIAARHRGDHLQWQADPMKLTGPKGDLSHFLRRDYRDGWDIKPTS